MAKDKDPGRLVSRRKLLQDGLIASAGLGLLGSSSKAWAEVGTEYHKVILIGSGFGASVAALRLGEKRIDTLVLERGRRWRITNPRDPQGTFATFENPDGRAFWMRTRSLEDLLVPGAPTTALTQQAGVLDVVLPGAPPLPNSLVRTQGIGVSVGAGVGGGSLVYNAITVRPREDVFNLAFAGTGAPSFAAMRTYYDRAAAIIGASKIPADVLASKYYRSTRLNYAKASSAAAQAQGLSTRLVDLAVDWNVVRGEMIGLFAKSAIAGQSWYGMNSGAKRSLDRGSNYIPRAEGTGRVQIRPLHVVTAISKLDNGRFLVEANEITPEGNLFRQRRFSCDRLFLGGGSLGSSALLVKAKAKGASGGLAALGANAEIGKNWAGNGDCNVLRAQLDFEGTEPAGLGGPGGHFIMEDLANLGGLPPASMDEVVFPPNLAAVLAAVGVPTKYSFHVAMGLAPKSGTFAYDGTADAVTLTWPQPPDPTAAAQQPWLGSLGRMIGKLDAVDAAAFVLPPPMPLPPFGNPFAPAHPLGGAVLGAACDSIGRVKGISGLYVVDGALLPGSAGNVNPSLTIAAVAEYCMERIITADF